MNATPALVLLLAGGCAFGVESSSKVLPVDLRNEKGSFGGQVTISMSGPMNKVKTEWSATVTNTSPHKIFRAMFCVKAFDAAEHQIRPGGSECVVSMWGTNWQPGGSLRFKGKQNLEIDGSKAPLQVARYSVELAEVFDNAPNLRTLTTPCQLVWPAAIRTFADRKFRPTVMDRDSFTATYAYDGGRIDGYSNATQILKAFTNANTAFFGPTWESFRIDAASLYLREEKVGECTAEVKMSFAGFGKIGLKPKAWYALDSTFNFERTLLDDVERQARQVEKTDMDKAISQLPPRIVEPSPSSTAVAKPQLTITSEPNGAEIEINGEFVGNTPTTIARDEGRITLKITKAGFVPFERTLTLSAGDKRTVSAEMSKQ